MQHYVPSEPSSASSDVKEKKPSSASSDAKEELKPKATKLAFDPLSLCSIISLIESTEHDEDDFIPPHEIILRRNIRNSFPSFSMVYGAGRTLKGRDLINTRNAVLRMTGFL